MKSKFQQEHTERTEMESNRPSVSSVASCSNHASVATAHKTKVPYSRVWEFFTVQKEIAFRNRPDKEEL